MTAEQSASHPVRALVTGVTGQDGFYLSQMLLERGWNVWGGLSHEEIRSGPIALPSGLRPVELELTDTVSITRTVEAIRPARIFHLAAQSHVPTSWEKPAETVDVNVLGTIRLIDALRRGGRDWHMVLAGTADCFDHGAAPKTGLSTQTPMKAETPYALSKLAVMELARRMRESSGLRISIAIMMNHTSPRRPPRFVERKIVNAAVAISRGAQETLVLGSLETARDWSWAEDIADAMILMSDNEAPEDFVLGSGKLHTTGDWVRVAFDRLGLDVDRRLQLDPGLLHRVDAPRTFADIAPAGEKLGWKPRVDFESMVERLIRAESES